MSTESQASTGKPATKPGVYRSDIEGHILILRWNSTSVTCITCAELCSAGDHVGMTAFKIAAETFTAKHGYLGDYLGENVNDMLKTLTLGPN